MKKFLILALMVFLVGCFNSEDNDTFTGFDNYDPPDTSFMTVKTKHISSDGHSYTQQFIPTVHGAAGVPAVATFIYSDGVTQVVNSPPFVGKHKFVDDTNCEGTDRTVDVTYHYFTKTKSGDASIPRCWTGD